MFTSNNIDPIVSILVSKKLTNINNTSNINKCHNVFDKIKSNAIDKFTTYMIVKDKNKFLKEYMVN
jgi:hypothetical protein